MLELEGDYDFIIFIFLNIFFLIVINILHKVFPLNNRNSFINNYTYFMNLILSTKYLIMKFD